MTNQSDSIILIGPMGSGKTSTGRVLAKEMGLIESIFQKSERNINLHQNVNFDKKSLKDLVCSTLPQVNIIECKSFFIKPFTHDQMMKCLDEKIINKKIIKGLYDLSKLMPDFGCELLCVFGIEENLNG